MMSREGGLVLFLLLLSQQGSTQVPSEASLHGKPTYASVPQQTSLSALRQSDQGAPQQTNQIYPLQTNPGVPRRTSPIAPTPTNPNIPPPTLSRARGVRLQVNPYFNLYFQDSSNRNLLQAPASRLWNYGRPAQRLNYRNSNRGPFANQALRFFAMNELFDFL